MIPTTPEEMDRLNRRVAELRGWLTPEPGAAILVAPSSEAWLVDAVRWTPFGVSGELRPCTDARQAMALLEEMQGGVFWEQDHWTAYSPALVGWQSAAETRVAIVKAWIAWKEGQS